MRVVRPPREEILALQARESAFYFSAAADAVLHKLGIRTGATRPLLVLRESDWRREFIDVPSMFEGCVSPGVLEHLGLSAVRHRAESLELFDADNRRLGRLTYFKALVRRIPASIGELSEPYPYQSDDPRWNVSAFDYQEFDHSVPRPVLFAQDEHGIKRVVGISHRRCVVLGVPLWDVVVQHHTSPPYDAGYYAMSVSSEDLDAMERWCVEQLSSLDRVELDPIWPEARRAALTIRHDYDRQVKSSDLRVLLRFYKSRRLRSTWFWRIVHLRNGQAKKVARRGHEVALHTEAASRDGFRSEIDEFRREIGTYPEAYSAHGGIPAVGHLGLRQVAWAIEAGMIYGEALGLPIRHPCQAIVIEDDIPSSTSLVIPAVHRSLDLSTAPGGHCYEELLHEVREGLSRGEHVVVMNHPDIHGPVLRRLLDELDYEGVWKATLAEVSRWSQHRIGCTG